MNCLKCDSRVPEGARFCHQCGTPLIQVCVQCNSESPPGARFCSHCGLEFSRARDQGVQKEEEHHSSGHTSAPQHPHASKQAERRQLTCLFCDLVGSTQLSDQLDAEEFRELILDYQQIAEREANRFGGHVAQYLGDGLLVYFGYPKGLEDAPRAAVKGGLSMLKALQEMDSHQGNGLELSARVGIHTGLVVVDDFLALGKTVNLAARLESIAPENGVVISEATKQLVEGWFSIEPFGTHALKGINEPVEVFRVTGSTDVAHRMDLASNLGLSPLCGREEQMNTLRKQWHQAQASEGQVIVIHGEAGIGKSRLVRALRNEVQENEEVNTLVLRSTDYLTNTPFHPILDLFEQNLVAQSEGNRPDTEFKIKWLEDWISRQGMSREEYFPPLAELMTIQLPEDLEQSEFVFHSPQTRRKKVLEAISQFMISWAREQTLLMIVEDLHWADASTLEWLQEFAFEVKAHPIMLICTTRLGFQASWLAMPHVSQLYLNRLDVKMIETICFHQAGGKSLPGEVITQIQAKTEGIPLFVEELTRMIIQSDQLLEKNGGYVVNGSLPELAIPVTLKDSLIARLDQLPDGKEIAQIGSVIGREFSFSLLNAVTDQSPEFIKTQLSKLISAGLIFPKGTGDDTSYIFKHALIQDTAYDSLLHRKKQEIHKSLVEVLRNGSSDSRDTPPTLLAHHLMHAGYIREAIDKWQEAGLTSMMNFAMADSIEQLETAFGLLSQCPDEAYVQKKRLELLLNLVSATTHGLGYTHPDVEKYGSEILATADPDTDFAIYTKTLFMLEVTSRVSGRYKKSLPRAQRCMELAKKHNHIPSIVSAHSITGQSLALSGKHLEAQYNYVQCIENYTDEVEEYQEELGWGDLSTHARGWYALTLFCLGYPDQSAAMLQSAYDRSEITKNFSEIFVLHLFSCTLFGYRREYDLMAGRIEKMLAGSRKFGSETHLLLSEHLNNLCMFMKGDDESGMKTLDSYHVLLGMGVEMIAHTDIWQLIEQFLARDDLHHANLVLDRAFRFISDSGDGYITPDMFRLKGRLLHAQGQPTEAISSIEQALEVSRHQQTRWCELRAAYDLALVCRELGRHDTALSTLEPVCSWFKEGLELPAVRNSKKLIHTLKQELNQ